jgi:hypothetical protein
MVERSSSHEVAKGALALTHPHMKPLIAAVLAALSPLGALSQGTILFDNHVGSILVAPIYGPDPANPMEALTGNTPGGTPPGATLYGGPLLAGSGFTAQLWGGPDVNSLVPATGSSTATFLAGGGAGFWPAPPNNAMVVGVPTGSVATLQVRAWDNQGGTITTWAEAVAAGVPRGVSAVFTSQPLGFSDLVPYLVGFTSFNIAYVPEPSTLALGALGAAILLLFRRRRHGN